MRHIVRWLIPQLMVLFIVVLAADESRDFVHAIQDISIEMSVEIEPYDVEWDGEDEPQSIGKNICADNSRLCMVIADINDDCISASAKQSDSLLRGQVRRYAPRDNNVNSYNYIYNNDDTAIASVIIFFV